ncbi:MAG TPA: hypothetical protein VGG71_13025, partial [Chitinophagaceae bacterium]
MKQIKVVLVLLLVALSSASQGIPKQPPKVRIKTGNGVRLEYVGALTGMMSMNIGIQVEIDSTIGFRYEVTFERGTSVLGHTAIFYKFSAPDQTIIYNFLNHEVSVNKESNENSKNFDVAVLGNATIDSLICTHLQHTYDKGASDYWMSPNLPGFSQLTNAVNKISSGL